MNPRALLICVGSELLHGKINTHAATLSRRLLSVGLNLAQEQTLPDHLAELTDAIRRGLSQFEMVIVTGGLGPTFDDLSREAAAAASGRSLTRSPKLLREITAKFRKARYKAMPPANARQADLIQGAVSIPNAFGTAPGQWLELPDNRLLILLPGPPRELIPMVENFVLPHLRKTFVSRPRAEGHLHFVGIGESAADEKIRPILDRYKSRQGLSLDFTILASPNLVDFDVHVEAESQRVADQTVAEVLNAVRKPLKAFCYGEGDAYPIEKVVGDALRKAKATLAVVESCTGGLLAGKLTDQTGSSDYFLGGIVSYANSAKETLLNVDPSLIRKKGAVSPEVAWRMATGVRQQFGSTYGISITGIAGPNGGTAKKPVGLVFIGVATPHKTTIHPFQFSGSRDVIRHRAVTTALDLLRKLFHE